MALVLLRVIGLPVIRLGHEQVQKAVVDALLRAGFDLSPLLLLDHANGHLGQIANHALHVAAVVADLGVLRGLDFEERRADELRQPPGDFSFAHAGRPDHDDVLGRDVLRSSSGNCWRRQRLRMATATARLAASWPTMYRSSSWTICRGVNSSATAYLLKSRSERAC